MKLHYGHILFSILLVWSSALFCMGFQPKTPMDEAQMLQEYEQLQKSIDEYIAGLSPQEQQEFYEAQKMYEDMFNQMTEEERNQYMEELYKAAEEEMAQYYASLQGDEPIQPVEIQKENTAEKEEPIVEIEYTKYSEIISIVEKILNRTESFLIKINSIPDIATRVVKWAESNDIKNWLPTTTWGSFLHTIELHYESIAKLLEKNNKTGLFKYLDGVLESKPLVELLKELSVEVDLQEPIIKIASFGLEPMTKDTKNALKKIITAYLTFDQKIQASNELQQAIAKFDPEAARLKQEEQAAIQAAQAGSVGIVPAAGTTTVPGGMYSPSSTYPSYQGGSGYSPYSGGYQPYNPTTPTTGSTTQSTQSGNATPGGGSGGTGDAAKNQQAKVPKEKDSDSERVFGRIELLFTELNDVIKNTKDLSASNLKTRLTDVTGLTDSDTELVKFKLPSISRLVTSCTNELSAMGRRVRGLQNKDSQKAYTDDVKGLFSSAGSPLKQLFSDIKNTAIYWISIPNDKRKLFFGSVDLPSDFSASLGSSGMQQQNIPATPVVQPTNPTVVPAQEKGVEQNQSLPVVPTTTIPDVVTPATGVPVVSDQTQFSVETLFDVSGVPVVPNVSETSAVSNVPAIPGVVPVPQVPVVQTAQPEASQQVGIPAGIQPTPSVPQEEVAPVSLPPVESTITLLDLYRKINRLIDMFNGFPAV